jgi:hypothetical protein
MRPLLLGDVVAAARSLKRIRPDGRAQFLARLIAEASAAERHRRKTGCSHPDYGDGSLMAAALAHGGVREPSLEDADYCLCLALVLSELAGRRFPATDTRRPLSS